MSTHLERFYLELTEHTLILARVVLAPNPVVEDLREIWLGDPAALETALREAKPAGAPDSAIALLHPRSRAYFRANPHQAATVTTPETAQYFLESMLGADGAAAVWSWINPRDGRPPVPGQPWIIEATRPESSQECIGKLAGWTFRVENAQSATFALAGALVSISATGRTLLCDFTDAHTNLFSISAQGIDATATVPGGFDTLAESTQAALALKFRGSAARLLFNESYDFSETSAKIVAPLADIIQQGLAQMGAAAPTQLVCSGLAGSQRWIVEALGRALGLTPLAIDGAAWASSQGLALGPHITRETIAPAWLGLLSAAARNNEGPWQIPLTTIMGSPPNGAPQTNAPVSPPVAYTSHSTNVAPSEAYTPTQPTHTPLTSDTVAPFARSTPPAPRPTIATNSRPPSTQPPPHSGAPLSPTPPASPVRPSYTPPPSPPTRHIQPIVAAPEVKRSIAPILIAMAVLLCAIGAAYHFLSKSQSEKLAALAASNAEASAKAELARKIEAERILNARGSLTITSDPIGALVTLENREPIPTPARITDLRLGRYIVNITADGYEPEQREIEIKENAVTDAGRISLRAVSGTISITSQPERLTYELRPINPQIDRNKIRTGFTPDTLKAIPVGEYELIVTKPEWRPTSTVVSVSKGNTTTTNINLSSSLRAQRNGNSININWQLPPATYRGIEIMRNTISNISSRDRVGIGREATSSFKDNNTNPNQTYWYWIKVTYTDGKNDNLGPVEVPASQ